MTYGNFTSSENNDCSAGARPSLSIEGEQLSPPASATFHLTLCLPSPDDIGSSEISLPDDDKVQVIDASAEVDGCAIGLAGSATGTARFLGYCEDGLDPAGYALELSLEIPAERTCNGDPPESLSLAVSGRAAVAPINL